MLYLTLGCAPDFASGTPARAAPRGVDATGAQVVPAALVESRVHVVQAGETLWRIARQNGVTIDQIARANGVADPRSVRVGQKLKIPGTAVVQGAGQVQGAPTQLAKSKTLANHAYPLRWPLDGAITSRFGARDGRKHDGIDIDAPMGASVHAAASGQVIYAGSHSGYGNLVIIRHASGLVTIYAHNSRLLVRKGSVVGAGQVIASVGVSGRTTGSHLHFEVRKGVVPENPLHFLPP